MPARLSQSEALAFRQRWALVAERAREEQAASTLEQRFDELEMCEGGPAPGYATAFRKLGLELIEERG